MVVFMADDQDMWLGGETPIPKTRQHLADGGIRALNFFVATPVCCPSRTETLTGRYMHNLVLRADGADGRGHDCMNQNSTNVFNENALFPTLHSAGCVRAKVHDVVATAMKYRPDCISVGSCAICDGRW